MGIIVVAFGSTLMDLASPWLIKYVASEVAFLQMASWMAMVITALALIGVPTYEMWFKKKRRKK